MKIDRWFFRETECNLEREQIKKKKGRRERKAPGINVIWRA